MSGRDVAAPDATADAPDAERPAVDRVAAADLTPEAECGVPPTGFRYALVVLRSGGVRIPADKAQEWGVHYSIRDVDVCPEAEPTCRRIEQPTAAGGFCLRLPSRDDVVVTIAPTIYPYDGTVVTWASTSVRGPWVIEHSLSLNPLLAMRYPAGAPVNPSLPRPGPSLQQARVLDAAAAWAVRAQLRPDEVMRLQTRLQTVERVPATHLREFDRRIVNAPRTSVFQQRVLDPGGIRRTVPVESPDAAVRPFRDRPELVRPAVEREQLSVRPGAPTGLPRVPH